MSSIPFASLGVISFMTVFDWDPRVVYVGVVYQPEEVTSARTKVVLPGWTTTDG